jgi:metal-responsive CopG/Arc/MetJ family transcriptional regulator
MKMNTIDRIGLSISKIIIEKVDNDRGDIPRSRFIERILKKYYQIQEPAKNKNRNKKSISSSNLKTAAKQIDSDELTNT